MDDNILAFMRNMMRDACPEERNAYEAFLQSCLSIVHSNVPVNLVSIVEDFTETVAVKDEGDEQ
jgi:hypothetical protein